MINKVSTISAPIAKKVEYKHTIHGDIRLDDYYWMKLSDEQKNSETPDEVTKDVVSYLEAENTYVDDMMSDLKGFEADLFQEIKGRIKETDMSVPFKDNGYFYITRFEEGQEYPIYARKENNLDAPEQILLNVNELAKGFEYYNVSGRSVSPNNKILAYGEDTVSRRIYTIKFKNLETGELLTDVIPNTTGGITWANDNKTVFYTIKDDSLRAYKIFRHTLGTDSSEDVEVFHEKDETFSAYVYKTKSKDYIVVGSYSTVSQEYRYLDANDPNGTFSLFQERERNLEYGITHYKDKWFIRTNKDGAKNFKLMSCSLSKTSKANWTDEIAHRTDVLLEGVDMFERFTVLAERVNGISKLRILPTEGDEYYIDFGEEASSSYTSVNMDFDTDILRMGYTSMTTPSTTYDYNMADQSKVMLKQQEVLGEFNIDDYKSERLMISVRDGAVVPCSVVYHKDTKIDGSAPCLQYAYGSYGHSMDPYFSSVRLSLLNRGFVYVIAHIRGGEEMGRHWYEDGKLLNKKNTFNDFVDCGKYLIENNYSNSDKLFAMGGSAGGLLMGAIINQSPELWKGIVAQVPFVDVVTTMLDETIPLTTGEYDEWGNPNEEEYYHYIKSYSPLDNIERKDYPSMLVTTGYFDSQVQYWEPAKWVAKLRDLKTDNNPLLFKTNMGAGHGGASGRFERYKEIAVEYAFICGLVDITE
ncbi:S9 family peptidase [Saprospiraceae bacterium]|nr:S9 family peptidase [Saprospiraceae bacterium]